MSKAMVVYWSMSGNTQAMAEEVAQGLKEAGAEVELKHVGDVSVEQVLSYERLALGCPAMGTEELEDSEFEPFFASIEGSLGGRKLALFGSYGWGDGQWMRDWQERAENAGAQLCADGLAINGVPDSEGQAQCRALGARLAG